MRSKTIVAVFYLIWPLISAPERVVAHPLGNFSINQYAALSIGQDSVAIRYVIDMAEIPAFQEIQDNGIIANGDDPNTRAYLAKKVIALGDGLSVAIGGQRLTLRADSKEIVFPPGAGGLPTVRIDVFFRAMVPAGDGTASYSLDFRDGNFAGRAGWKEIVATSGPGAIISYSSVPETDRSAGLVNYPTDLLNSSPQDLEARVVFSIPVKTATMAEEKSSSSAGEVSASFASSASRASIMGGDQTLNQPVYVESAGDSRDRPLSKEPTSPERPPALNLDAPLDNNVVQLQVDKRSTPRDSFTELMATKQLGWSVILVALAVAVGLGAFHALEPGHGKTLVAAYLVGSRGTMKHALLLGLIVTAAHTAGVYLLGGIALYASRYIVPERLYPWLEFVSGVIIAVLGAMLFIKRYRGKGSTHSHDHGHGQHIHRHDHEHEHDHRHAGRTHYHRPAHEEAPHKTSTREVLTLGISGGIVPCPAALVVLLSGVAMNRAGFGLLLIVAFSAGLAAVLIAIGMLMVYARRFMSRFKNEGKWVTRWLPITSSLFILLLGIALIWKGFQTVGLVQGRL